MSIQPGNRAPGQCVVDGLSLCSVKDNHHGQRATVLIVGVGIHSIKYRLEDHGSRFLRVWNMNINRPQLTESRHELAVWLSSIPVPELCLLAHVVNSLERTKMSIFQVLAVQVFLALRNVEIHLLELPRPERKHEGPVTKHVLGVVLHETSKDFPKKA